MDVRALLERTTSIAVVGCSTNPGKAAHAIPRMLQVCGFDITPVHPGADEVLGVKAYRTLADLPEPVDLVNVFRPASQTPAVVRAAVDAGAKAVWLQLGIASAEARRIAEEAGLDYVEDACLGVEVQRFGIRRC